MKRAILAATLALAPVAASAQSYYEPPMSRGELRECMERDGALHDRLDVLDRERLANDRESDSIAREGQRLARQLATLDSRDPAAVAAYNSASQYHNRRVEQHNNLVAEMNARAALHNGDAADVTSRCAARTYDLRDRDTILRDRIR